MNDNGVLNIMRGLLKTLEISNEASNFSSIICNSTRFCNGKGICYLNSSDPFCHCDSNYIGQSCDLKVTATPIDTTDTINIFGVKLISVVFGISLVTSVALLFVVILVCRYMNCSLLPCCGRCSGTFNLEPAPVEVLELKALTSSPKKPAQLVQTPSDNSSTTGVHEMQTETPRMRRKRYRYKCSKDEDDIVRHFKSTFHDGSKSSMTKSPSERSDQQPSTSGVVKAEVHRVLSQKSVKEFELLEASVKKSVSEAESVF